MKRKSQLGRFQVELGVEADLSKSKFSFSVRVHQPSIYALFQTMLVMTNIVLVFSTCVVALRLIGACGASRVQDVTINYRLLFRAYTASSIFVFGFVLLGSLFVLTCDYHINNGASILEDFLKYYKGNVLQYLDEDIIKESRKILNNMVLNLTSSHEIFGDKIQVIIRDLLSRMEGWVFAFEYEIDQVKKGVDNMTSILSTEEDNVLHLPSIKYFVAYAITGFIVIVAISMTGMVGGFTLGYLNHNSKVSPLERNQLSNVAGFMLVSASYAMMFGVAAMLLFSSVVMLLGSIGDLYLCRAQRSGYLDSDAASLKDLTVSMVMKTTVNQYYVDKLLRFSKVKRHCVSHLGISGLASMSGKALHDATKFDKIGNCDQIKAVFDACFEMLCNGILDYMNGLWLALLLLVFCFLYAIYISLVGSKYLFTMTSYTFEGEPVPEGFDPLANPPDLLDLRVAKEGSASPPGAIEVNACPPGTDSKVSVPAPAKKATKQDSHGIVGDRLDPKFRPHTKKTTRLESNLASS